jgi:hypothetical protein
MRQNTEAHPRRAYSRLETDAELMARIRVDRQHALQVSGETMDATAARYGFIRRIIWEDK